MTRCRHCGFPIYATRYSWAHVANGVSGRSPCNGNVAEPELKPKDKT